MSLLNVWIDTFLKKAKAKHSFEDGVKSVVLSSVIIGFLGFLSSLLAQDTVLLNSFVSSVIILPIIVFVAAVVFVALFRLVAGTQKGRGDFKKDFAVFGVYLGSLVFVMGLVMFLFGLVMSATFPANIDATAVNYFVMFLLIGIAGAFCVYLSIVTLGVWLEELAAAERLSVFSTAKAMGITAAIIVLAAAIILGALMELSAGPYKAALAQYAAQYGTTGA